jgi:hypothetical protein
VVFSAAIGRFVSDEGPRRKAIARYHAVMSSDGRSPEARASLLRRAAIYVLPGVSVLVAALVFLGPGALRPALGARVSGLPGEGARAAALRIEVVRTLYEVLDTGGVQDLVIEASAPGQALGPWRGATGPDGIAEVLLPAGAPLHGPLVVRVTTGGPRPRLLAGGAIDVGRPPPAFVQLGTVPGTASGDLAIRVDTGRGQLASPFLEPLRVLVSPAGLDGMPGERAEIVVSGLGIDPPEQKLTTNERGAAAIQLKALAHQVELVVEAHAGGKSGRWEGTLPVVPGAMWLRPGGPGATPGAIPLRSPAPRERAYVSFWSEAGRIGGAVVPLALDPLGFYSGEVEPPEAPGARVLYAVVAGDPVERGPGTVAWPIRPAEGAVTPRPIAILLDGLPDALAREKQRSWTTRRAGLLLIGAAALAEMMLLLVMSRASQRHLEAHLAGASESLPAADRERIMSAAREHPALRALLAVALVGLGFAMVAALSTFR